MAEIKTLTKAGVSLAKKKLAWVPLIIVLFKGKKLNKNENKQDTIYFNTIE